jgi:hypothetical protein
MPPIDLALFNRMVAQLSGMVESGNPFAQYVVSDLSGRLDMWLRHGQQIATIPLEIEPPAREPLPEPEPPRRSAIGSRRG